MFRVLNGTRTGVDWLSLQERIVQKFYIAESLKLLTLNLLIQGCNDKSLEPQILLLNKAKID